MQERRSTERFPLVSAGCAIINGTNANLETRDASERGALVEFAARHPLKPGTKLRIRLNIGFIGRATICWVNHLGNRTLYGLRFDRFDAHSDLVLGAYFVKYGHHLAGSPAKQ